MGFGQQFGFRNADALSKFGGAMQGQHTSRNRCRYGQIL